jgi:hypothetical protein
MTWNKAALGGLGPAATVIMLGLDAKLGWNMGAEFWGAVGTVLFGALVYLVPNKKEA